MREQSENQSPDEHPAGPRDALDVFAFVISAPPEQRGVVLEQACRTDPALRAEVEDLLRHHDSPVAGLRDDVLEGVGGGIAGLVDAYMMTPTEPTVPTAGRAERASTHRRPAFAAIVVIAVCVLIVGAVWGYGWFGDRHGASRRSAEAWSAAQRAGPVDPVVCREFLLAVDEPERGAEWRALMHQVDPVVHRYAIASDGGAAQTAVEAAGSFLPSGVPCCALGSGQQLHLVDIRTGAELWQMATKSSVRWPCFDAAGERVAAWSWSDGDAVAALYVWEVATCALLRMVELEGARPVALQFVSGGRALQWRGGAARPEGGVNQLTLASGEVHALGPNEQHERRRVHSVAEDCYVDLGDGDDVVIVGAGALERTTLGKHGSALLAATFSPDGLQVAMASAQVIRLWPRAGGSPRSFARGGRSLSFDSTGLRLLVVSSNEVVVLDCAKDDG